MTTLLSMTTAGKKAGAPHTRFCLPVKTTEYLFPTQELLRIPTTQTQDLFFYPHGHRNGRNLSFFLSIGSQGLFLLFFAFSFQAVIKKKHELVAFSFLYFKIALQEICQMAGDLDQ